MPPMPAHLPWLTRGMKIYFNDLYYGLMTGANPAESKSNLLTWLDAVIYQCSATSLVLDNDGNTEHALFHSGILSGLNVQMLEYHAKKFMLSGEEVRGWSICGTPYLDHLSIYIISSK